VVEWQSASLEWPPMSTWPFVLPLLLAFLPQDTPTDRKPKSKDSVEVVVTGCLEGRILAATEAREPGVVKGPNLSGRSFRLAGKRDVMDEVKRQNGRLVEVAGWIRQSDLRQPGINVGGRTRVIIGAPPMGSDPTRIDPSRTSMVAVLDATAVRFVAESCSMAR
jgi:hypothetical protein